MTDYSEKPLHQEITFVTAFLKIKENEAKDRPFTLNLGFFTKLVSTGIRLHIFITEDLLPLVSAVPGVEKCILELIKFDDLECYQTRKQSLPASRTDGHDTGGFLVVQNAKIEIVKRAIDSGKHQTNYFSWIDFSIFHVISEVEAGVKYLRMLGSSKLAFKGVVLPGCHPILPFTADRVMWRFCGGFFLGDKDSIIDMYHKHRKVYQALDKLTWEVNVWAKMELEEGWKPIWFLADHNDSMIRIPHPCFYRCASLTTIPSRFPQLTTMINSLINQVNQIFIYIPEQYQRFPDYPVDQELSKLQFDRRVTVVRGPDQGSASKYLGNLSVIPDGAWILFCDDDQEYHSNLLNNMLYSVKEIGCYQNRYHTICRDTSGGLIHSFVGNLMSKNCLSSLTSFDLPEITQMIGDQWMSVYCHKFKVPILATRLENYCDIFSVLEQGREKWGPDSLSAIGNRPMLVKELERHFNIRFSGPVILEE